MTCLHAEMSMIDHAVRATGLTVSRKANGKEFQIRLRSRIGVVLRIKSAIPRVCFPPKQDLIRDVPLKRNIHPTYDVNLSNERMT